MPGLIVSEDGYIIHSTEDEEWFVDMVPLFHFYPETFKASARWSRTEELLPGVGSLPVDEIYVELQIVEGAEFDKERSERDNGSVDLAAMRRVRRENLEVLSVPGEQFLHGRHRSIAIVGDPGSGKTTFLKWCSLKMLHESDGRWLLPLPISLREYALEEHRTLRPTPSGFHRRRRRQQSGHIISVERNEIRWSFCWTAGMRFSQLAKDTTF